MLNSSTWNRLIVREQMINNKYFYKYYISIIETI